jgi:hypothetical protein
MSHSIKSIFLAVAASVLAGCGSSSAPLTQGGGVSSGDTGGNAPPVSTLTCSDSVAGRKQAYFGDLHVHTNYSLDAYFFNAINGPREAYRFAKGEPAGLPAGDTDPYTLGQTVQLDRPLDFTAVTDHAEFLGGWFYACEGNGLLGSLGLPRDANPACAAVGNEIRSNIKGIITGDAPLTVRLLRASTVQAVTTIPPWLDMKRITDEEYLPCSFTTLQAYEYTAHRGNQMNHRNVIFLGSNIPQDVFPSTTADNLLTTNNINDDWRLFDYLRSECTDRAGCEVLTIPHNSNLSSGRMFLPREASTGVPLGRDGQPLTEADARLRLSMDRAVELTQHKGSSECSLGLEAGRLHGEEDACDFELAKNVCRGGPDDPASCAQFCTGAETDPAFCNVRAYPAASDICQIVAPNDGSGPSKGCAAPLDMARNALAEGLAIKQNLNGVNPYRFGFVAGTDTHNGTPGNVDEKGWPGHGGVLDNEPKEQLGAWFCDDAAQDPANPGNCTNRTFLDPWRAYNPGGVTGVWAEENTREQIWHGIHRGETFGTSGPRMRIRTIATWDKPPADICNRLAAGDNPVDTGELAGARMGGDLSPRGSNERPWIVAWAMQDPGGDEPGNPLQRLDIIKSWVGADGEPKVKNFSGVAKTSAPVGLPSHEDCSVDPGQHPEQLCAVWQDSEFSPTQDALYYARALEVPSCRWSTHMCTAKHAECGLIDPANGMFPEASGMRGYEGCCVIEGEPGSFRGRSTFSTIEERAWASPIWYDATTAH